MGVQKGITATEFPRQGSNLNKRVLVCFHHDTCRLIGGLVVRDDSDEPGRTIIRLVDGRHVLGEECQYQLAEDGSGQTLPDDRRLTGLIHLNGPMNLGPITVRRPISWEVAPGIISIGGEVVSSPVTESDQARALGPDEEAALTSLTAKISALVSDALHQSFGAQIPEDGAANKPTADEISKDLAAKRLLVESTPRPSGRTQLEPYDSTPRLRPIAATPSSEDLVQALADALEAARTAMHRGEFGDKGRDRDVPAKVDAALRLAGRLP